MAGCCYKWCQHWICSSTCWILCVGICAYMHAYIHASWILDLFCWIFIHTCILDPGSFVLDLHTYMHLGSWVFCVGSYLCSSIGSSNVLFVRRHFGFFLAILVWIESLSPICCRSSVQVGPLVVDSMFRLEWLDCLEMLECLLGNKILKH